MAQTDKYLNIGAAVEFEQYGEQDGVALAGATPVSVLIIKSGKLRSVTIQTRIEDAAIDGDYIVYGTTKRNPDTSDITSDEWTIIKATAALTHNVTDITTISGNYSYIIVQVTSDSGTPTCKAWYKGKN